MLLLLDRETPSVTTMLDRETPSVTAMLVVLMASNTTGKLLVNMKTKISLQCASLLVFYSFLKIYYIEKEVKWEAHMGTGCLPVVTLLSGFTVLCHA